MDIGIPAQLIRHMPVQSFHAADKGRQVSGDNQDTLSGHITHPQLILTVMYTFDREQNRDIGSDIKAIFSFIQLPREGCGDQKQAALYCSKAVFWNRSLL